MNPTRTETTFTQAAGTATAAPAPADTRQLKGFAVVGIGASAGGLEALEELFKNMPPDTGMAFVVITHQHPGHTSLLPELLSKTTTMPVTVARNRSQVEPDHVYVNPPGSYIALSESRFVVTDAIDKKIPPLPIDSFFRSLASAQKERAICIILSGAGSDGTLGMKAIKGESGMAMVQSLQSARYTGMPSSAIATSLADYVLAPASMPKQLQAYVRGLRYRRAPAAPEVPTDLDEPVKKMVALLRARTGHDFGDYKVNTLRRRIERRMNVHQIKNPSLYLRHLRENPHELDMLFKELLIGVTSFFRDPDAFDSLADNALLPLMKSRPDRYTFRAWIPGCSSGEEAYTVAMILRACARRVGKTFEFKIFATDVDAEPVEVARVGEYPAGIAADVPVDQLERHFLQNDTTFKVRTELREMVVFAPQSIIRDPPLTKLDLLCCRNLLIYLNANLQKRLMPLFHYALKRDGILMLGPSETIGGFSELFDAVDKKWKIYRRKDSVGAPPPLPDLPGRSAPPTTAEDAPALGQTPARTEQLTELAEQVLIARFAPTCVIINSRGDIVYIHGRTGAYLEPGSGQAKMNILDMAREGLDLELSSAIRQSMAQDKEAVRSRVRVKTNGAFADVDLSVVRIAEPESIRGLLLVTFRPSPRPASTEGERSTGRKSRGDESARMKKLERDLRYTKESLQSAIEELETSNEEIKSSNEELQSTNEELQSANEELETSKEEMQSLNEELSTVNTELQSKVDELSQANDDMQNLLNSTSIATIFLDSDLNIHRYTQQAKKIFQLIPSDVGRPLSDLAANIEYKALIEDAREVLRTLAYCENEVRTKDGHWHLMRIMPYRTSGNVINGLVMTFVDINRVKLAERHNEEARAFCQGICDILVDPMVVVDEHARIRTTNRAFREVFREDVAQMESHPLIGSGGVVEAPGLEDAIAGVRTRDAVVLGQPFTFTSRTAGSRVYLVDVRRLRSEGGTSPLILLILRGQERPGA